MLGRAIPAALLCALTFAAVSTCGVRETQAARPGQPTDWKRFYYYPYVYYPHSFQRQPQSYNHLYYRYPASRRIPVYRKDWHNFYPSERPYYRGNHFMLDVF